MTGPLPDQENLVLSFQCRNLSFPIRVLRERVSVQQNGATLKATTLANLHLDAFDSKLHYGQGISTPWL